MRLFSLSVASIGVFYAMPNGVGGEDGIPNDPFAGFHPVGNALIGVPTPEMDTSLFGKTVAVSSNGGNRLLVGVPAHGYSTPTADDSQVNPGGGAVFLYQLVESVMKWELVWFLAGLESEALGSAVSISADGSRVAIRRRRGGGVLDIAEIYEVQGDRAVRLGSPIGCIGGGSGLSLAPSGDRVAVSCESFDSERGRVAVFDYNGTSWYSNGVFEGTSPGDLYGWNTAFSSDGKRLAISAPSYSLNEERRNCGLVQVYEWKRSDSWDQVGGNLTGYDKFESSGMSMDMSSDGRSLAVGSPGSDFNGLARSGAVRVFYNLRGIWVQTGSDITGLRAGDELAEAVSISGNGGRLVVSSPNHGTTSGYIRSFLLQHGEWIQHGEDISGLHSGTRLGSGRFGVSLDGAGKRLAYGSPFCGLAGCVRVVEHTEIPQKSPEAPGSSIMSREGSLGKLDWDITFVDASARFVEGEPASIVVNYEIHTRTSAVTVYESDCKSPVPNSLVSVQTATDTLPSGKQKMSVDIDINMDNLSGSPIFSEPETGKGLFGICVRLDLLDDDMRSIVFDQRRLSVVLDTSMNFEVLDVKVDETEEQTQVQADVEYAIKACQCDESFACVELPVHADADTLICIDTETDDVRVASVEQLQFFKGSLSQIAVREGHEDDLTVVTKESSKFVVRTRLVSAFFEGKEDLGIHTRGQCTVSLLHDGSRALRKGLRGRELLNGATYSDFSLDLRIAEKEKSSSSSFASVSVTAILVSFSLWF